ncbi:hypothetical protein LUX12_10060 [Streptomyces somaliensis]|uniref:hypothetical protein n=1 Tax=Streptomyces somaliensis TaxID=78355 RepID=UPI0020CC7AC0|nr:hypothetical protein [Streptomyces somaliensis]MCP9945048.1 hypothetical protein [Streptomyces somaliensis]MCP9961737.1 hypothetical protein [Streptomyces somaliensis]MCP9974552.1 hypothetical protein [Streptomyces somaliensis]
MAPIVLLPVNAGIGYLLVFPLAFGWLGLKNGLFSDLGWTQGDSTYEDGEALIFLIPSLLAIVLIAVLFHAVNRFALRSLNASRTGYWTVSCVELLTPCATALVWSTPWSTALSS